MIFISLGVWQLKRLAWKQDILTRLQAQYVVDARSVAIDPSVDLSTDIIKKGYLKGRFLHDKAILVNSVEYKGMQGYYLITPFEMVDFDNKVVFVNRGWVPLGIEGVMDNNIYKPDGIIMITGYLRHIFDNNGFTQRSILGKDILYNINLNEIAKAKGIDRYYYNIFNKGLYKRVRKDLKIPIAVETKINISNNHAGYALFWFLMAIILMVIYFLKFIAPQLKLNFR